MPFLNEYKIEFKGKKKEKAYKVFSVLSPIMMILSVAFIFLSFFLSVWYVFGVVGGVLLALVFDIIAKQNVFTIQYAWNNGVFTVKKISIDGKESVIESIQCEETERVEIVSAPGEGTDLTDKNDTDDKICVKMEVNGKTIFVSPDKYMYSLIHSGGRNDLLG